MTELQKQSRVLFLHPFTVVRALDELTIDIVKIHREMKDLANVGEPDKIRFHLSRVDAYEKDALQQLELIQSKFLETLSRSSRFTRRLSIGGRFEKMS